jgi:hypothetical protein
VGALARGGVVDQFSGHTTNLRFASNERGQCS